jgi:hypothetical protein
MPAKMPVTPTPSETEVLAYRICERLMIVGDERKFSSSILSIMGDLGLENKASIDAALRWAVDNGWLVTEGHPPHSIRLAPREQRHV